VPACRNGHRLRKESFDAHVSELNSGVSGLLGF
jgi:hypothetical protein